MKSSIKVLLLFVWVSFSLVSCSSSDNAEDYESESVENEDIGNMDDMEKMPTDSVSTEQRQEFYCCTNHTPRHCGDIEEIEELSASSGCTGFK